MAVITLAVLTHPDPLTVESDAGVGNGMGRFFLNAFQAFKSCFEFSHFITLFDVSNTTQSQGGGCSLGEETCGHPRHHTEGFEKFLILILDNQIIH